MGFFRPTIAAIQKPKNFFSMFISALLISLFTFVELNCENLFDCQHDSLKNDTEFLADGLYRWTPHRYWQKLNRIGQTIIACGGENEGWQVPDIVVLCEVENDTVMRDLTKRSLLRKARYEYVMTDSSDERGIDVALMYSPFSFQLINHHSVRIEKVEGMRPTRDILYTSGRTIDGDTLHIIAAHFPSRRGGELQSRPYRVLVANRLCQVIDSVKAVSPNARIIVAGDLNDYSNDESIKLLEQHGLIDVSSEAKGSNGAMGTYRYHGLWGSLDHILTTENMMSMFVESVIIDPPFLLKEDEKYGGVQPRRNYLGPRYMDGFSDHLPLVARFNIDLEEQ